ncbi:unnamed protein product, partial [Heterosigma akashiwo]
STTSFVSCGDKHIKFWSLQGRNLAAKKGLVGRRGKLQAFTCVAWVATRDDGEDRSPAVGTAEGKLYLFDAGSKKLAQTVAGHKGAVYAVSELEDGGLVSGGKDGVVICWGPGLVQLFSIDLKGLSPPPLFQISVRSVHVGHGRLLVGTQGSEIYELPFTEALHDNDGSEILPLVTGHCKDELWGLCCHPTLREYVTTGDDGTLRVWSIPKRRVARSVRLGGMARCCAYSHDGVHLAVGMGGSVGRGRQRVDGAVRIFAAGTLELLHEIKDSKQWISDVKYSPDGKYLAVGSHDNAVYLYKRRRGYARSSVFKKHNSYISHLDFSRDSQYLQSTCGAYELLFCDAHSGAQVPAASQLRNVRWETWTLPLGWPVQGIWPPCSDGTDINSVARSHSCTLLATADDFGKVKLFRYPCADKTADFQEYSGHSSHVTNDDGLLVLNLSSGPSSGDQFMAVKPWLGAIKAPTAEAMKAFGYVEDGKPPRVSLELEWIYGYRCHDARNNLHYNAQGDAVYHTAAVGVVLKRKAEEAAAFGGGA